MCVRMRVFAYVRACAYMRVRVVSYSPTVAGRESLHVAVDGRHADGVRLPRQVRRRAHPHAGACRRRHAHRRPRHGLLHRRVECTAHRHGGPQEHVHARRRHHARHVCALLAGAEPGCRQNRSECYMVKTSLITRKSLVPRNVNCIVGVRDRLVVITCGWVIGWYIRVRVGYWMVVIMHTENQYSDKACY